MRKIKRPRIGEYVLATKWRDHNYLDPWHVGHISCIIESVQGIRYMVDGSDRQWRNVFRISKYEGMTWLRDINFLNNDQEQKLEPQYHKTGFNDEI